MGISGASGVIYGVRMLGLLKETDYETHLIISDSGRRNLEIETDFKAGDVEAMADHVYEDRAADVNLKEGRKLVLVVRETPLHKGHLRLMTMAADMGTHILPPVPSFYHQPKTIQDIIDQTIGKVFDYVGIEHELFRRWEGSKGVAL